MSRSLLPLTLSLFAMALLAVPAALAANSPHRVVRGVCTQQSPSSPAGRAPRGTCTADSAAPKAGATGTASQAGTGGADDGAVHDVGDDHGRG